MESKVGLSSRGELFSSYEKLQQKLISSKVECTPSLLPAQLAQMDIVNKLDLAKTIPGMSIRLIVVFNLND